MNPDNSAPHTRPLLKRSWLGILRNSDTRWGLVTVLLHWTLAVAVIGLFVLGEWMTGLSYYDPWYKQGPDIHRAVGVLVGAFFIVRLVWRSLERTPEPLASHKPWERRTAHLMHGVLYGLVFALVISGYLISTADGRAVSVFGWFDIPATLTSIPRQEDLAGDVHHVLAAVLISAVGLHALAALKHHFIDKDATLKRMFRRT